MGKLVFGREYPDNTKRRSPGWLGVRWGVGYVMTLLIPGHHTLGLALRVGMIHGGYAVLSGLLLIWMVQKPQNKQKI